MLLSFCLGCFIRDAVLGVSVPSPCLGQDMEFYCISSWTLSLFSSFR